MKEGTTEGMLPGILAELLGSPAELRGSPAELRGSPAELRGSLAEEIRRNLEEEEEIGQTAETAAGTVGSERQSSDS